MEQGIAAMIVVVVVLWHVHSRSFWGIEVLGPWLTVSVVKMS